MRQAWVLVLVLAGCNEVIVRDAATYRAEVDFVEAAAADAVAGGVDVLQEECACAGGAWTTDACARLAETVVVLRARMSYHAAFMRYLGGLSAARPSAEPPPIPASTILCPASVPAVPLRDGGVE